MKLKTKYAAGMRDELEGMLGCPVEVVEDREANYSFRTLCMPAKQPLHHLILRMI